MAVVQEPVEQRRGEEPHRDRSDQGQARQLLVLHVGRPGGGHEPEEHERDELAEAEVEHEGLAHKLGQQILTPSARAKEDETARRMFVLQYVQPGLAGLMDGSVSTLAPLFAAAFATHNTWETFLVGLAASVGAGISMGFAEALSDDGSLTGPAGDDGKPKAFAFKQLAAQLQGGLDDVVVTAVDHGDSSAVTAAALERQAVLAQRDLVVGGAI